MSATTGVKQHTIEQYLEYPEKYLGKKMSLSMKYRASGSACIYLAAIKYYNNTVNEEFIPINANLTCDGNWHEIKLTGTIPSDTDINYLYTGIGNGIMNADNGFIINQDSSIEVEWIKLEEGNICTRYIPPSHYDELQLCKRFFQIRDGGDFLITGSFGGHSVNIFTHIDVPMRDYTPTRFKYDWQWARVYFSTYPNNYIPGIDFGKLCTLINAQITGGCALVLYMNYMGHEQLTTSLVSNSFGAISNLVIYIDCEIYIE